MIAALITATIFGFPGGGEATLASSLATHLKTPVAIMLLRTQSWEPFQLEYDDRRQLLRLLQAKTLLSSKDSNHLGLSGGMWPAVVLSTGSDDAYRGRVQLETIPKGAIGKQGITYSSSPGGALLVGGLTVQPFSKRFSTHWLYGSIAFVLSSRRGSETEVLAAVASAIGAKLVDEASGYSFAFDPKEYRTRSIKTHLHYLSSAPLIEQSTRAYIKMYQEAVSAASDEQLTTAFRNPGARVRLESSQVQTMWPSIHAYYSGKVEYGRKDPVVAAHMEKIDLGQPPHVEIDSSGRVIVLFRSKAGGGLVQI